jgi:hypothetical protein
VTIHIVVATLAEGDETDTQVFGPFQTSTSATTWCDTFEKWMGEQGGRTVKHLLITRLDNPVGTIGYGTCATCGATCTATTFGTLCLRCATKALATPVVHLHGPISGPVCGAPWPYDRVHETTAYRSHTTCPACLATITA